MSSEYDTINSYLSFKVGEENFATHVANVLNILEMTKITQIPKSPKYMKGVINLRGSVLPIMDTRTKFGLEETEYTNDTCILVLEINTKNEKMNIGAIVDSVQEVLELKDSEILPAPSIGTNYKAELLTGMAKKNDKFIMLLNVDLVFGVEDILNIKDLTNTK